jgi:hypothetical protein
MISKKCHIIRLYMGIKPILRALTMVFVCLAIVWLIFEGSPGAPFPVEAQRGLIVNVIKITDPQGQPLILYKESHALLIGNSTYTNGWPSLSGVRHDIEEVKTALEAQGFDVIVKMDLNKIELDEAFSDFISRYGEAPENRLVFYFAGHGHTVKTSYGEELGYIVPVDTPNPNYDLTGFQSKAMEMQQIEIYAKRIQSKHALFLFDSCFSGSLFALSRALPEIITYKTANPVRQFITSGSADETVPDESVFRSQFVRALQGEADTDKDGYVTGTELGEFLQTTVVNYTHNAQHPQYGKIRNPNLDKGDFVFNLPKKQPEETALVAPPETGSNFGDIENQLKWQDYLNKMEDTFATISNYEKLDAISGESKIAAWERFLKTFAGIDPYTTHDEELRSAAQERIRVWKEHALFTPTPNPQPLPTASESTIPTPPSPPTATVTPEPAFRITNIVITDARGKRVQSVDDIYAVKLSATITIAVEVESPPNHTIQVTWTTRNGKVRPIFDLTNTYTAQKVGTDYVIIYVWDKETGDGLEEPINITVVP